jgi:hypothetical protein
MPVDRRERDHVRLVVLVAVLSVIERICPSSGYTYSEYAAVSSGFWARSSGARVAWPWVTAYPSGPAPGSTTPDS